MASREKLTTLTDRWRERHDARRLLVEERPAADPAREALAARAFPFRSVEPAAYVAEHGDDMHGFTYDEARYADPALDAWLIEAGRLLRKRR
jgi:hypothetical protein